MISVNSKNNLVHSTDKLVAIIGLENIVIVETADAFLVAQKDQVQGVKTIVDGLKHHQHYEHVLYREVQRPWELGEDDIVRFEDIYVRGKS